MLGNIAVPAADTVNTTAIHVDNVASCRRGRRARDYDRHERPLMSNVVAMLNGWAAAPRACDHRRHERPLMVAMADRANRGTGVRRAPTQASAGGHGGLSLGNSRVTAMRGRVVLRRVASSIRVVGADARRYRAVGEGMGAGRVASSARRDASSAGRRRVAGPCATGRMLATRRRRGERVVYVRSGRDASWMRRDAGRSGSAAASPLTVRGRVATRAEQADGAAAPGTGVALAGRPVLGYGVGRACVLEAATQGAEGGESWAQTTRPSGRCSGWWRSLTRR